MVLHPSNRNANYYCLLESSHKFDDRCCLTKASKFSAFTVLCTLTYRCMCLTHNQARYFVSPHFVKEGDWREYHLSKFSLFQSSHK